MKTPSLGVRIALGVLVFLAAFCAPFVGAYAASAASVTHHHSAFVVTSGVMRDRPVITVSAFHIPACATDPTVVALDPRGHYAFWGYRGTILRGHPVEMTLELNRGTHGTWRVLFVDAMPCGNADGGYSWTVGASVTL